MPPDRYTARRRTQRQVQADERAGQLAAFLGRSLLDARRKRALTQAMAAERAGISQSAWSSLERGRGAGISLRVWERACDAVYADLRAYLEGASAAEQPRDAAHLRQQELVARIAAGGGWSVGSEAAIGGAGVADLVLRRPSETALVEIWNWFADVGDALPFLGPQARATRGKRRTKGLGMLGRARHTPQPRPGGHTPHDLRVAIPGKPGFVVGVTG
jgi:transcriptional regulator with XRE-family HTH domain